MIKTIQYLRFFAALIVVFAHANLAMYDISPKITNLGAFGVDVFFVISGFIMPYIIFKGLYNKESITSVSAIDFVSRRIVRVWPLYLLTAIVTLLLSYFVSSGFIANPTTDFAYLFNASKLNVAWFFETMSFTHWDKAPILGIGWTLQLEFVFYCAIAGLLLVGVKKIEPLELGLMLLLFFTTVASFAFDSNLALKVVTFPIVLEFIFGVLLYRLVSADCLISPWLAVLFIAASVPIFLYLNLGTSFGMNIIKPLNYESLLSLDYFYRPMAWGLLAFLLVWSFLSLEKQIKNYKLLLLLGDSSYSMYLCHSFLAPLYAFFWMTFHLHEAVNVFVYLVSCLVFCQVFAVFVHQRVELPLNAFVKRNFFKGGFAKRLIGWAIFLYLAICLCLFVVSQVRAQSAAASVQKPLLAEAIAPSNLKIEPSPDGAL
jgi:exopolysaccharide production protein ExoZ